MTPLGTVANHSLRRRLLLSVMTAIVLAALFQAVSAYRGALMQADEMFDYHLQQMALSMRARLPARNAQPGQQLAPPPQERDERRRDRLPDPDLGRRWHPAVSLLAFGAAAARGAGLFRRAPGRHDLPRVFDPDAVPDHPDRTGHERAHQPRPRPGPARHAADGLDRAALDADDLGRDPPIAVAAGAHAPPGGQPHRRRFVAAGRGRPARRSAPAGAGAEPAVRPHAHRAAGAEGLRRQRRARAAHAAHRLEAASPGAAPRARRGHARCGRGPAEPGHRTRRAHDEPAARAGAPGRRTQRHVCTG
jgi:hypothetical protein